ncbi:MAG: hypothetical protein H6993_06155 [Pseudomonadales bacterium]|nr:hypothetical protein [Pseudomonadales bacterium]MCP5183527.1 hypothetical protein [Pseudomonadales bacterium]
MSTVPPTQIPIERNGKKYPGIYSVSGTTLIARIPGLSSRSAQITEGNPEETARKLLNDIIDKADGWAHLQKHR